ncbi:hypothetical protein M0R45_002373 [Rubus argutus]|uniref:DUF641 domain-containing protein n=1 Tax=Rubus argutus TaxID=59490 RepID=A0AAW1VN64_RUBAR
MDSVSRSAVTPTKSRLARTIAKVLHLRAATGIAPVDGIQKVNSQEIGIQKINYQEIGIQKAKSQEIGIQKAKSQEIGIQKVKSKEIGNQKFKSQEIGIQKVQDDWNAPKVRCSLSQSFDKNNEKLQERVALEALLAKLFASISSFDPSPETTLVLAEIEEQKSVLKTYEIMGKKLNSQVRLKDSEIIFLGEKLEEANKQNKLLEKRVNQSGQLYVLDNLHLSGLSPSHFITLLRHTVKSIRSFVRTMMDEMKSSGWDIHMAANSIAGDVLYWKEDHKYESLPDKKKYQQQLFFERFMELKPLKAKEHISRNPRSAFAKFCRVKYLRLIHPKMETSFSGNLNQRNLVNAGEFPSTSFFASFADMAKRVWLLHCLAFSFDPEAAIFQVSKGCRFSEVYMESVAEEAFLSTASEPLVGSLLFPDSDSVKLSSNAKFTSPLSYSPIQESKGKSLLNHWRLNLILW